MEFKKDAKIVTSEFWYDLTDGGYLKPDKLLENQEDIEKVNAAIETLRLFRMEAENQGILEEI